MIAHDLSFLRGVAMALQGESLKASAYVAHSGSLGALREKIIRRLLRDNTPDRYRVETGLIRNIQLGRASRQCDILVHEPADLPPFYRWEDFVIVDPAFARAVIEVKSNLGQGTFDEMVSVNHSLIDVASAVRGVPPMLGFCLKGASFDAFVGYVSASLASNDFSVDGDTKLAALPDCIVVQEKHYLGLRPSKPKAGTPWYYCAVDLDQSLPNTWQPVDGIETGIFLYRYQSLLSPRADSGPAETYEFYSWFNRLPVDDNGKVWIEPNGTQHLGAIPGFYP